jgi:hypothetical protein
MKLHGHLLVLVLRLLLLGKQQHLLRLYHTTAAPTSTIVQVLQCLAYTL